jgi:glycosyltransferase involved in cell wall biosynthesis
MADRAADILLDADRRRTLGAQARRRAEQQFSREQLVDTYESYYRSLLNR